MRLSHIVISLPLLLCATPFASPVSLAQAAGMDATQATALLAKSQTLDAKCDILAADKSQDLKDFVARAELSLAEKSGVSVARKTIAGGRAAGKAAPCDETAQKLVNDVLAAASVAAALPVAEAAPEPASEPQQLASQPVGQNTEEDSNAIASVEPQPVPRKALAPAVPLKPAKVAKLVKPVKAVKPAKAPGIKGLGSYAKVAETYYVALRCGNMSASRINALYGNVLSNHQQAMASNRPSDVRAMLRKAEARAGGKRCS